MDTNRLFIKNYLQAQGIDKSVIAAIEEAFCGLLEVEDEKKSSTNRERLLVRQFNFVIPDDQLHLLEAVASGLQSALAAGFILGVETSTTAIASGLTGVVSAIAKVILTLRKKGAVLDPCGARILSILCSTKEGLTLEEIQNALDSDGDNGNKLDIDRIAALLEKMRNTRARDGTTIRIVDYDDETNKWWSVGV